MTRSGDDGDLAHSRHQALVFDDDAELLAVAGPWLQEGLDLGEAAVVCVSAELAGPLQEAVGNDPRLLVVERNTLYRPRTPTALTAWRRFIEQHAPAGRRIRAVGEPDFGSEPADWLEWQAYESVVNVALGQLPLWSLCVFSTDLPEQVLTSVRRTHPQLTGVGGGVANSAFVDPVTYLRTLPVPDEPLEATSPALADDDVLDPIRLRHTVRALLRTVDGPPDAIEDSLLAVDEFTFNAVRHGARPPASVFGLRRDGWCARSATPAPDSTTRSPATGLPATTWPPAGWASGWPGSCATTSPSAATPAE